MEWKHHWADTRSIECISCLNKLLIVFVHFACLTLPHTAVSCACIVISQRRSNFPLRHVIHSDKWSGVFRKALRMRYSSLAGEIWLTATGSIIDQLHSRRCRDSSTMVHARWRFGVVYRRRAYQRHTSGSVSTGMGDRLWAGKPPQYFIKPLRPTQPPPLSGTGNEYQPKCSDALRLESKGRRHPSLMMWFHAFK